MGRDVPGERACQRRRGGHTAKNRTRVRPSSKELISTLALVADHELLLDDARVELLRGSARLLLPKTILKARACHLDIGACPL